MYRSIFRPILFRFSPETAHNIIFSNIKIWRHVPGFQTILSSLFKVRNPKLERTLWGIKFPTPVGLAAGLDKNATGYDVFDAMGYGFIEVGTATPKAQPGNPKPRLFRLVKDNAIINRMGFNNIGADAIAKNLQKSYRKGLVIGGNIGKNTATQVLTLPMSNLSSLTVPDH